MKKSRCKRILSVVLCVVMILGVIGFGGDRVFASSGTVPKLMNNFINNQSVVYKLYMKEKSALFL